MDKKTVSWFKSFKRRSFFLTLFKGTTALVVMNSFPFKLFASGKKRGSSIKIEMNELAVKRNKRG